MTSNSVFFIFAVNAAICSTFEVQYGKLTSTRTTAIGHLGYLNRSRADTHEQVLRKGARLGKLERAEVVETNNRSSSQEPLAP